MSNHDHSHVTWQAGARDNRGGDGLVLGRSRGPSRCSLAPVNVLMLQAGQEFGEDHWLPEDDQGTGRRVRPRPLRWRQSSDSFGSALLGLYSKLCRIRNDHSSIRSRNFHPPKWDSNQTKLDQDGFGVDTDKQVVVYHRWGNGTGGNLERFIIALNFSNQGQAVTLQFPANGAWSDMLRGGVEDVSNNRLDITLEPNWGHIFFLG